MANLGTYDDNGNLLGLAPQDVVTILKDIELTTYKAIKPVANVGIYFAGGAETTYTLDADVFIYVHPNLRLVTDAQCLVY